MKKKEKRGEKKGKKVNYQSNSITFLYQNLNQQKYCKLKQFYVEDMFHFKLK